MSVLACRYASEDIRTILYNVAGRDQEEPVGGGPVIDPGRRTPSLS